MEFFAKTIFDIVTTYNDEICYTKHVLDPLCVFLTLFGCLWGGGGGTKGSRANNLLVQFSGLGSSKMEISETDFFDTLTIQNDQISYVKHVLAPLHVFFNHRMLHTEHHRMQHTVHRRVQHTVHHRM